jgi:ABC-type nitrate/sulfonate/bicarbonate transport system permease component
LASSRGWRWARQRGCSGSSCPSPRSPARCRRRYTFPYAIAILPTFKLSAIFVVFIGAFWPIFQNAVAGAHALEQRYRDNARILGLTRFEYQRRVVFPAALPHIFTGMAVGLAFSFILLTVAELFGANAGLGRFVQYYADFADYPKMVAGILYTGLVTFLAMTLARRRPPAVAVLVEIACGVTLSVR